MASTPQYHEPKIIKGGLAVKTNTIYRKLIQQCLSNMQSKPHKPNCGRSSIRPFPKIIKIIYMISNSKNKHSFVCAIKCKAIKQ